MMLVFIVLLFVLLLLDTTGVVVIVTVFAETVDADAVWPLSIDELLSDPSCLIFLLRLYGVNKRTGPDAANLVIMEKSEREREREKKSYIMII